MVETKTGGEAHSDRELVTSRTINAPRDHVFQAFMDPTQLARWWGPRGFTNTFEEYEPRAGGRWRFVMHGPDGKDYPNESIFVDITPPHRVILRHVSSPHFELTITLEDVHEKTKVTWRQRFETAAERQRVAKFAVQANEENLDRLENLVTSKGA
jgi:uncharacterized protein YndB with AHSA1/START domain